MDTKVYMASIEDLPYEKLYNAASRERKAKADSLHFTEDKCRCIAAGALLRHALNDQGIYDFQVMTEENGKPYIQGLPVHFSLSHSGSFVLCALSDKPVGCDIQWTQKVNTQLARRYFAPREAALLENLPPEQARELFCRLWVLKESLGKALGCGLSESILGREFDFSAAAPALQSEPELCFREYSLPGYRCAVCAQKDAFSQLIHVCL